MKYNFVEWLKAAGIRAIKTVAQTAGASIGTSAVMGEVNWPVVCSASILAGILSLLTSLAGLPELDLANQTVIYVPTDEQMDEFHPPADEQEQKD